MKYVVGSICSFSHRGILYTEGMEISPEAFASEDDFKGAVKLGKIVPAPEDEDDEGKKEYEAPAFIEEGTKKKKDGKKKKDATGDEAAAAESTPEAGNEAAAEAKAGDSGAEGTV